MEIMKGLSSTLQLTAVICGVWMCHSEVIQVGPPEDVRVTDVGQFGPVVVEWSPPSGLRNVTHCHILYQLEYLDTRHKDWTGIQTPNTFFHTRADFGKGLQMRLMTRVSGACTGGQERTSPTHHITWTPQVTGLNGTDVKELSCVFHKMQHMECVWHVGTGEPSNSQRSLFYWQDGLEMAAECPQYIHSPIHGDGLVAARTGCTFPHQLLKTFTDFNVCVNGSSSEGPLRPSYFSLQIEDYVKPGQVQAVSLEELVPGQEPWREEGDLEDYHEAPDQNQNPELDQSGRPELGLWGEQGQDKGGRSLVLSWSAPDGLVPEHCLEYQVETLHQYLDGRQVKGVNMTRDPWLVLLPSEEQSCARVRSRMHQYCANKSFWSDWTPWTCWQVKRDQRVAPAMDMPLPLVLLLSSGALISLLITAWAVTRMLRKKTQQKKMSQVSLL